MKPDMRMFTIDWKTNKITVDHGFNIRPSLNDWQPDPTDFPNEKEESEDDEP
jgi:hypothetical protein